MAKNRLEQMKQYIHEKGKVTVSELSKQWNITEETVRRDLDKLEADGILTRIHGGAIWNESIRHEGIYFYQRQRRNFAAKRKLATLTLPLIKSSGVIFADASSTVLEMLRLLADEPNLIVVTNSAEIFLDSANMKMHLISTGGIFNNNSMSFQGEVTKNAIRKYNAKLAVIGCKGMTMEQGVLDSYESEAEIKKVMLEQADQVVLLIDHTKFDQIAFLKLIDFDQINYVVTDRCPSDSWIEFFKEHHIQLIYE